MQDANALICDWYARAQRESVETDSMMCWKD